MATLRRNWRAFTLLVFIGLLGVPILIPRFFSQHPTAAEEPAPEGTTSYTALAPVDQDALRNLRMEVGLDPDALIALNVTAEQAEQVLAALRSWYETHQAQLHTLDVAVTDKEVGLYRVDKMMRTGPALPDAQTARARAVQELAAARNQRTAFIQAAATAATAGLSTEQQALLVTLQANRGQPLPYRLIVMTAEQKQAFQTARRHYERQVAQARDADTLQTLASAWNTRLAGILDTNQQERITSLAQYGEQASELVLAAQQKVLPQPEVGSVNPEG
jgi:hypothetical protein